MCDNREKKTLFFATKNSPKGEREKRRQKLRHARSSGIRPDPAHAPGAVASVARGRLGTRTCRGATLRASCQRRRRSCASAPRCPRRSRKSSARRNSRRWTRSRIRTHVSPAPAVPSRCDLPTAAAPSLTFRAPHTRSSTQAALPNRLPRSSPARRRPRYDTSRGFFGTFQRLLPTPKFCFASRTRTGRARAALSRTVPGTHLRPFRLIRRR